MKDKKYELLFNKISKASEIKNYFDVVLMIMSYSQQIKILHWQTNSYAQHKAFDGVYEAILDSMDTFVEVMQGKYGRFNIDSNNTIKLDNYASVNIVDFNNKFTNYLVNVLPTYFDSKDTELLNIRDEMLQEVNQLKYLLTLG